MTAVSVELLMLLELSGMSADHAVALGALIGPAQVVARAFEGVFARPAYPYWSLLASSICALVGVLLLSLAPGLCMAGDHPLRCRQRNAHDRSRSTLPLALYNRADYANVMGRLARPPLIGQALTPSGGGSPSSIWAVRRFCLVSWRWRRPIFLWLVLSFPDPCGKQACGDRAGASLRCGSAWNKAPSLADRLRFD